MSGEGRGLDLYSLRDEPPHLRPQYDNLTSMPQQPPPPPVGVSYSPPVSSVSASLRAYPSRGEREPDRDRGRVKERDERNHRFGSSDDGQFFGEKAHAQNSIARRGTIATTTRPKAPTRRTSSLPGQRSNAGGNNERGNTERALTRPKGVTRRTSSQPGHRTNDGSHDERGDTDTTVARRGTNTRPRGVTRRSSSHVGHGTHHSERGERHAAGSTALRRTNERPKAMVRRSSSHPGYGQRPTAAARRTSYTSDSEGEVRSRHSEKRVSKRAPTEDQEKVRDYFSKTPTGIGAGAVGAVVGGWAARKAQDNYQKGKKGSGSDLITLFGATVGGLLVNTVVDRMEEKQMVRQVGKGEMVTAMRYTGKAANLVIDQLAEERMRRLREAEVQGRRGQRDDWY